MPSRRRLPTCVALVVLLLCTSVSGCLGSGGGDDGDGLDGPFDVPTWSIGDWWLYTFTTPRFSDDTTRLVVAENDSEGGTAYTLAISSHTEARRHAVLNHNPFLGRISHDNLSAYENGEPQPLFQFPFKAGDTWSFSLFATDWNASVVDVLSETDGITSNRIALIAASAGDGSQLAYVFDENAGFLRSLIWTDGDGVEQLDMQLVLNGIGHEGEVWFIRGGDLYDGIWEHSGGMPDADIRDTFFVSDHPDSGEWDEMIYWLDARMGSGSSTGSLTLRDHTSVTALSRTWGPGAQEEGQLGTIPYPSGEYTLTITQTGDSYIAIIIAGGIEFSWVI